MAEKPAESAPVLASPVTGEPMSGQPVLPTDAPAAARCANCGVVLAGRYCHHCGQPDREVVRFFGSLLRDFFAEVFSLDSRAARTLLALCFRPGHLTNAYLSGRRYRYVAPLRLFLLTSLLAIFFVWTMNLMRDSPVLAVNGGAADKPVTPSELTLVLPGLSDANQQQLQGRLDRSLAKVQEDPEGFIDDLLEIIPNSMLLLVPLLALYMRLLYPLANRYYIEHLIHALHGHAFLFVMILLLLVLESLPGSLGGVRVSGLWSAAETAIGVWIPVYLLLSTRRVYRQGWGMTLFKFVLTAWGYLVLLVIATVLTVLVGVLLT